MPGLRPTLGWSHGLSKLRLVRESQVDNQLPFHFAVQELHQKALLSESLTRKLVVKEEKRQDNYFPLTVTLKFSSASMSLHNSNEVLVKALNKMNL